MTTPYRPTNRIFRPTDLQVSSVTPIAPPRPRLVVELFERRNFGGRRAIVLEDIPNTRSIGLWDETASSVKVYRGPGYATSSNYKAIFHEHPNYIGRKIVLGPGYYPDFQDIAYDFGNMVSAVSFAPVLSNTGPDYGTIPLIVEVYQHVNFEGRKVTVIRDIDETRRIYMNDSISSIRVFRGPDFPPTGCKVIFFEHVEFGGQYFEVELGPMDYRKELPNLHTMPRFFGDVISSIKLESWVGASSKFREIAFVDEFATLDPAWQWIDPRGDCRRLLGRPAAGGVLKEKEREGWLEMHVGPNHDLWWGPEGRGGNMDGPRMLREISGDFALEVHITSNERGREHGGILVWKNENRFVRLDKTSRLHGFRGDVRFEAHVNRRYQAIGRGRMDESWTNYLRLERTGHEFKAYSSINGQDWQTCGVTTVVMRDPILVGMHSLCPGNMPSAVTRFDYFKVMRAGDNTGLRLPLDLTTRGTSTATTQVRRP